ncbi:GNAT family N-acetyltransferase [Pseudomonas aeruginosa]|uniref:GNAT family N-acetyltransferase n=1 Tax=Pseudomonas aeruginosa TaxID=287 RepID=UPI001EE6A1B1|nr:GNAT family N-acetyltransferase [Pseudomonas aeruginosa]
MSVSLRPITKENYEAVCELEVSEEQEQYVACNMWSLVEANFNEDYETRAIYLENVPVGFFMWTRQPLSKISIWRFMIDQKYQKRGIGRIALGLAINEIKKLDGLKSIEICYNPKKPSCKGILL